MIEFLERIDHSVLLAINGCNSPFFDSFFWIASARITWIPLYCFLFYLIYRQFGLKNSMLFLVVVIATISLVDVSSVHLFKETVQRFRPSHNGDLSAKLHYYIQKDGTPYLGGQYGFVSSHASNFWALTALIGFTLKKAYPYLIWILVGISLLVCYSRIYLGVHYPSDVAVGGAWGFLIASLMYIGIVKQLNVFNTKK